MSTQGRIFQDHFLQVGRFALFFRKIRPLRPNLPRRGRIFQDESSWGRICRKPTPTSKWKYSQLHIIMNDLNLCTAYLLCASSWIWKVPPVRWLCVSHWVSVFVHLMIFRFKFGAEKSFRFSGLGVKTFQEWWLLVTYTPGPVLSWSWRWLR